MVPTVLSPRIACVAHSSRAARVWLRFLSQTLIRAVSGVLGVALVGNAFNYLKIVIRHTRAPMPRNSHS